MHNCDKYNLKVEDALFGAWYFLGLYINIGLALQ